jgi:ankyrin repeat protein
LHIACRFGHSQIVTLLIPRLDVNGRDKVRNTLLEIGCLFEELSRFFVFLQNGKTALHFASQYNPKETVLLLLNNDRVDVNLADHDGNTALSLACEYNNQEIVLLLVRDIRTELGAFENVRK